MKMAKHALCLAGAMVLSLSPARADNQTLLELLKILHEKGTLDAAEYRMLLEAAQAEGKSGQLQEETVEPARANVALQNGRLEIRSEEKAFSARIGGRIHADYAVIDDDRNLSGNASEIRRARLQVSGTAYRDWRYKAQVEFAGDSSSLRDFYFQYNGLKNLSITLGQHFMPNGLEPLTSSNNTTFMERSVASQAFGIGRQNGLSVSSGGDHWSVKLAAHLDGVAAENDLKNEDYGYGLRATLAPWAAEDRVWHLGVSYNRRHFEEIGLASSDDHAPQLFRARPEIRMISERPFSVLLDGVRDTGILGLESAVMYGPFSVQGEYFSRDVNTTGPDVDFDGWYVFGSYLLTGESRRYRADQGVFSGVRPANPLGQRGMGAWELALRYSRIDLYQMDAPIPEIGTPGQKGHIWTLGLNWYATPSIRFMANYVDALVRYPGQEKAEDEIRALQFRGQVTF